MQAAATPAMDSIAREGRSGTMLTLPEGYPTSSDVANMSVLGCDLATELCGRGPLEAASRGIPLGPDDICFRFNLVSVAADGRLLDFSGGHIAQEDAEEAVRLLNAALGTDRIRFYSGVSYRNLLVPGSRVLGRGLLRKARRQHGQPRGGAPAACHRARGRPPPPSCATSWPAPR